VKAIRFRETVLGSCGCGGLTSIENLTIFVDYVHLNSVLNELLSVHFDLLFGFFNL